MFGMHINILVLFLLKIMNKSIKLSTEIIKKINKSSNVIISKRTINQITVNNAFQEYDNSFQQKI